MSAFIRASALSFLRRTHAAGFLAATLLSLFAFVSLASAHEFKAGDLVIQHPWSRAAPAGAKVAGGYFVVRNDGSEPDRLLAVAAEIAGRTEIHEMSVDDKGVMTMRPLEGALEIPAGGALELKPGSIHLMFMDLESVPQVDERFAGTLTFEKAGDVAIDFKVEAIGAAMKHGENGSKMKLD